MIPTVKILCGDCLRVLKTLPEESVHCCVTSPPYWGLRDYGVAGQLGLERTPEEYVEKMVEVFREVRRVLRGDGILFLNLGDSYWGGGNYRGIDSENTLSAKQSSNRGARGISQELGTTGKTTTWNLKPKDLCGIPWRVAFALQADGWWLRSEIIWHKPNPMPESVTDRPTKSHEQIFLLAKSATYFYDAEAVKEEACRPGESGYFGGAKGRAHVTPESDPNYRNGHEQWGRQHVNDFTRNRRSVWTVPSQPYPESHFATFPPDLIKPCILAGTSARGCCPKCGAPWERVVEKQTTWKDRKANGEPMRYGTQNDCPALNGTAAETKTLGWRSTCTCDDPQTIPCTVIDPFFGSGTSGEVSLECGRNCIGIDLKPEYVKLAQDRCNITPGFLLA